MPIRRCLIALLPLLLLTGCGSAWMLERLSYPEDRALARAAIGDLIAGDRAAFAARLPEQVRPQLASQFAPMRAALPRGATDILLVDAGWVSVSALGGADYRDARLAYEIAGDGRRALAQIMIRRQGDLAQLTSFNVSRLDRPAREVNAFRAGDGSAENHGVLILAVVGLATTLAAIWRIWRSGLFRRRWLWTLGCLLGLLRVTTVWGTSQLQLTPISITLFSAGAFRQGLGPWMVMAGIPVIAIWALLRHRSLIGRGEEG